MPADESTAMEGVEPTTTEPSNPPPKDNADEDDEEFCSDLSNLLDSTSSLSPSASIPILTSILAEPQNRYGPVATSIKERSIYALARAYCGANRTSEVVTLLTGDTCRVFFSHITKAKCAKVVRAVLDAVCTLSPLELELQSKICENIISWCVLEKRSFLRQRVEAKLASILFSRDDYKAALSLINKLLGELKKLDDKQLLVETHLIEARIHHGLRGIAKAKAALTASRTAANAIYVAPSLQAEIDMMSGTLHCEEADYDTAHSYFLEAFEQLDQLDDVHRALPCLKYMMLCKILDSLGKALKISAQTLGLGGKSTSTSTNADLPTVTNMISSRQSVKYAGTDIEAMSAIAQAATKRSLKQFDETKNKYKKELQDDLVIKHHLHILKEQLLESNLIRIIEPYSCVQIAHVAALIELPLPTVEKKLSQMILDKKFHGILDQGKGQLIVYEDSQTDLAMEKSLHVIENIDQVVTSLFARSRALRTMMV